MSAARRGAAASALALVLCAALARGGPPERRIAITAKKFEYAPDEIHLRAREPVVFSLTSLDRTHGFSIPDFGVRADIPAAGAGPVEVRWVPPRAGRFPFACDVVCGAGHETMSGTLIVE